MEASREICYKKLSSSLEELIKLYRNLLDLVRKEKDLLLNAQLEALNESNQTKEALLSKIKATDSLREIAAKQLAKVISTDIQSPRLLDIATRLQLTMPAESEQLRQFHGVLVLLIERVAALNRENAQYTETALKSLGLALGEVKSTLGGKKTYARKGSLNEGPNRAGNFVSKEA